MNQFFLSKDCTSSLAKRDRSGQRGSGANLCFKLADFSRRALAPVLSLTIVANANAAEMQSSRHMKIRSAVRKANLGKRLLQFVEWPDSRASVRLSGFGASRRCFRSLHLCGMDPMHFLLARETLDA